MRLSDVTEKPTRRQAARAKLARRRIAAAVATLMLGAALVSCADAGTANGGTRPTTSAPTQTDVPPPTFVAGGTADENLPFFTWTLEQYAASGSAIEGQPVVDTVVGAGFDRSQMQVSFDRTKTNLVADFIFVSVRVGDACLLGQVSTSDGSVASSVQPTVGPDASICLIGQTRPIDW